MTKVQLLTTTFDPPAVRFAPQILPPGEVCAMTGDPIDEGIPANALLTEASSAAHEIFPVTNARYVSVDVARCYKDFKGGLTGNLLAIERSGAVLGARPMLSPVSAAEKKRPTWQSVLYGTDPYCTIQDGDRALAIITEEAKRRLWLQAVISTVGRQWRPFVYWQNTVRLLNVNVDDLRRVLALVEHAVYIGYSREAILTNLSLGTRMEIIRRYGWSHVRNLENAFNPWLRTDELLLAAFVVRPLKKNMGLEAPEKYQCLIPQL